MLGFWTVWWLNVPKFRRNYCLHLYGVRKNSFMSLQHPPQLVHCPVDGSSAFLWNVEIFSDCTARKPKRRPPALDEARHLLSVTDRVTLSEWTSSNPELEIFQQPDVFALHRGNRASIFLEPLLLVCSTMSSQCNSAQFFVTAGCEEFDRNINCVDYCTNQVVNWRFFGTTLKRFIESKRVPLAKLPSHFMCVSTGLFWLGCRRMEVHDRCWVGYTRFVKFITCVRKQKRVQKRTNDAEQGCHTTFSICLFGWVKRVCVCVCVCVL